MANFSPAYQTLSPSTFNGSWSSSVKPTQGRIAGRVSMHEYRKSQTSPSSTITSSAPKQIRKKYALPRLKENDNYEERQPLRLSSPSPPPSPRIPGHIGFQQYSEHGLTDLHVKRQTNASEFTRPPQPPYPPISPNHQHSQSRPAPHSPVDSAVSLLLSDYSYLRTKSPPSLQQLNFPSFQHQPRPWPSTDIKERASTSTLNSRKRLPRPPEVRLHRSPRASISSLSLQSDLHHASLLQRSTSSLASTKFQQTRAQAEIDLRDREDWYDQNWQRENWQFSHSAVNNPATPPETPVEFPDERDEPGGPSLHNSLRRATADALAKGGSGDWDPIKYLSYESDSDTEQNSWEDMDSRDDSSIHSDMTADSKKVKRFADFRSAYSAITSRSPIQYSVTPAIDSPSHETYSQYHPENSTASQPVTFPPKALQYKDGREHLHSSQPNPHDFRPVHQPHNNSIQAHSDRNTPPPQHGSLSVNASPPEGVASPFSRVASPPTRFTSPPNKVTPPSTRVASPPPRITSPINALRNFGHRLSAAFDKTSRQANDPSLVESFEGDFQFSNSISPHPPEIPPPDFDGKPPDYFVRAPSRAGHYFDPDEEEGDESIADAQGTRDSYEVSYEADRTSNPSQPEFHTWFPGSQHRSGTQDDIGNDNVANGEDLYATPAGLSIASQIPYDGVSHHLQPELLPGRGAGFDIPISPIPLHTHVVPSLNTQNTMDSNFLAANHSDWVDESETHGSSNDYSLNDSSNTNDSPFHLEADLQSLESPVAAQQPLGNEGSPESRVETGAVQDTTESHSPFHDDAYNSPTQSAEFALHPFTTPESQVEDTTAAEHVDQSGTAVHCPMSDSVSSENQMAQSAEPCLPLSSPPVFHTISASRLAALEPDPYYAALDFDLNPDDAVTITVSDVLAQEPRYNIFGPELRVPDFVDRFQPQRRRGAGSARSADLYSVDLDAPAGPTLRDSRQFPQLVEVGNTTSHNESTLSNLVRGYQNFDDPNPNINHASNRSIACSSVYSQTTQNVRYSTMANLDVQRDAMNELGRLLNVSNLADTPGSVATPRRQPEASLAAQTARRSPGQVPSVPLPPLPPNFKEESLRPETTSTKTISYGDTKQLLETATPTSTYKARDQETGPSHPSPVTPMSPTYITHGWGPGRYHSDRSRSISMKTPAPKVDEIELAERQVFSGREPRPLHLVRSDFTLPTTLGGFQREDTRSVGPLHPQPHLTSRRANSVEARRASAWSLALFGACFLFPPFLVMLRWGGCDWIVAGLSRGRVGEVDQGVKRAAGWAALFGFVAWCIALPVALVIYFVTR